MITPNSTNTKKSKKKASKGGAESPDDIKNTDVLNQLNQTVQQCVLFVDSVFEQLPSFDYNNSLEDQMSQMNLNDGFTNPVPNKLKTGFSDVSNEIRNLMNKKVKYLKSLCQWPTAFHGLCRLLLRARLRQIRYPNFNL